MSYPRFQFTEHLHLLEMSYGYWYICDTCATYGSGGKDTYIYIEIISSLL